MQIHFCEICGQQLTDPESIERGMGKVCAEKQEAKEKPEQDDAAGD